MARRIVALFMFVILAACSDMPAPKVSPVEDSTLPCEEPAPILGEPEAGREGAYFVCFKDGVDVPAEAARLAEAYGFTPRYVYGIIPCFAARDLLQEVVDSLRCEPTVDHLAYDGSVVAQ